MEHKSMILRPLLSSSLFASYFHFHLTILLLVSNATIRSSSGFTNETDRQALLVIKDLVRVDPFKFLSSWNDSLHFCSWQGVTCGHRHQRVTALNMSSLELMGSLSPRIGNLTFLRVIDIEHNNFHGSIPQEVGRLFRLQYLFLGNNSFQGEVPTNLTHCLNIKVIDASLNNLGGKIPTQLSFLSNLLELSLSKNHFTGIIPTSFGNLTTLHTLFLNYNNLEGSIPLEIGQLSKLEILKLSSNNLSGMVPTSLYNISSINIFSLSDNFLHGTLPQDLGFSLPKLQLFYIGGNQFSGTIPASITNSSGLVGVDISSNAFRGAVPMNLGSLSDLEMFEVSINQLGSNKSDDLSFLDSLTNCTNLRQLYSGNNHFGGVFRNSIANLSTKLTLLELQQNYIYGSIPLGIGNLIDLGALILNENLLTGSIPESIGKLSKLEGIYLHTNNIAGKIPSSIGNITQLSILALQENLLGGSLPASLGNCTKLISLDLEQNHLTGVVPEQIIGLSSITKGLSLAKNNFTGPLPLQVGNLKNLGILDISENELSGGIPGTLGDCLVLEILNMKRNRLEGTIPSSFKQLRGIQVLDLSHNSLSGQIPRFLGELPLIQNLNLSYNMFEGEVPVEGLLKNISKFSVVGNKNLCGGIKALQLPACPIRNVSHRIIIPLVVSLVIFVLACLSAVLYWNRRSRQNISSTTPLLQNQYPKISFAELLQATDQFSSANLIGEGRYGSVYRGILNSGEQIVAVKVLKLEQHGADRSFLAECEALRNLRHRNLVKVITSCSSIDYKGNDFKALVFEFMPNGSLEGWLHPNSSEQQNLNLVQRLNIAIDVASALDYLHHHSETIIIHCDLKPSNVLLDNDLCAHVGDFGLARILLATTDNSNHTQSSSIGIRGTTGYVAPEYGMGEEPSTQGDMYSYGILLLEMFTGKRPTDNMFMDNFSLHNYVKMAFQYRVCEIVDPQITLKEEDGSNKSRPDNSGTNTTRRVAGDIAKIESCLASVLQIGVACSAELPSERMDVRDVVMELHGIRKVFLG